MTDNPDNSSDRLETLLRQWGAEQAAGAAPVAPAPPVPAAPPGGAQTGVRRWAPLAAAAVLLIAAGGLYVEAQRLRRDADRPVSHAPPAATQPDSGRLARLKGQVAELTRRLADSDGQLASLAPLPEKLEQLRTQWSAEQARHRTAEGKLAAEVAAREKANRELADKVAGSDRRIAALEKQRDSLRKAASQLPQVEAQLAAMEKRLQTAAAELERVGELHESARAAHASAQRELALVRARQAGIFAAFQRTYLAANAPGEDGLRARKTAARARRMVERCALLYRRAGDEANRRLLEKLEVVLTRLELLDTERAGAQTAFSRLLEGSGLTGQIEQALAATDGTDQMRAWLMEAKLILIGTDDAI